MVETTLQKSANILYKLKHLLWERKGERMTVSESYERYDQHLRQTNKTEKTRKNYRTSLRSFTRACGDIPVGLITMTHIYTWTQFMSDMGLQPSSQASNISRLREVLKYMRILGLNVMDSRDVELPTIPRKQYTWLTFQEVKELLGVIDNLRDKAIIACLFSTGCRISELLNLNRDDIKDGEAVVWGKGDKPRTVYFDQTALEALGEYLETRKDKLRPLFVSAQYRRITVARVQQFIHVYADHAGLDKIVTPHVLRHSYASDLKRNGADIYDIKELLGHSQISTTMRYTHIEQKKNRANHNQFHSA